MWLKRNPASSMPERPGDQLLAHQVLERGVRASPAVRPARRPHPPRTPAPHRRGPDHAPLGEGQPVEARGEQRLDRGRHGDVDAASCPRAGAPPSAARTAGFPRRARRAGRARSSARPLGRQQAADQRARVGVGERARARACVGARVSAPHSGRCSISSSRARQTQHQRSVPRVVQQVLDQVEQAGSAQWRSSNTSTTGRSPRERLEQLADRHVRSSRAAPPPRGPRPASRDRRSARRARSPAEHALEAGARRPRAGDLPHDLGRAPRT